MTINQYFEDKLEECAMFPEDIAAVMTQVRAQPYNDCLKGRWNDNVNDYPPVMINMLWASVREVALSWIDENCPEAWFRELFVMED